VAVARLILGLLLTPALAGAEPPDGELLSRAEAAFAEGAASDGRTAQQPFLQAAADYEALRQRGVNNAPLYLNQGNAYLLAGDLPRAILAYRRGLRLAPRDPALLRHLDYAREQVVHVAPGSFGRPPVDHWPPWLLYPPPGLAVLLASLFYGAACLGWTRWLMTRRRWPAVGAGAAFLLAAVLAAHAAVAAAAERTDRLRPPVVIASESVPLHRGNGHSYPAYPWPLPRGTEARLLFERGPWLQIELTGGEVGWVQRADVVGADEP
jgi:tetratricopeptide (TPR) repeat protein